MLIRPACPDDAAAIVEIWNPIIQDSLTTFTSRQKNTSDIMALLASKAANAVPFLVAEQSGTIQGFATYDQFRSGPGYARTMELSINLAPAARGKGVGRRLLAALEETAKRAQIHCLIAGVSAANPGGIAFHRACGFAQVARLSEVGFKQGQWLDLVLLQKKL